MGEVAIVTGGASGIGAALGSSLVRRGAHVVLADVDGVGAARNATLFTESGPGTAESVVVDVRDARGVADLVQDTRRTHGRLDLMFNNAGIGMGGEPEELSLAHWDRVLDVNLRGVVHGCQAAYPVMTEQGSGHIVNTASMAGLVPTGGLLTPYATSKHAVVGLSLGLRAAGAGRGVHVNMVCPLYVDTPILDKKGPEDLPVPPSVANRPTVREILARRNVKPYPPERLADDVLRGVARNKAIIVAPFSAYLYWLAARLAPSALEHRMAASTTASRRRHPTIGT
jgi:NAD(P)-dependent dehydrogenase (short-subunit alcohol dehydrogenase family)